MTPDERETYIIENMGLVGKVINDKVQGISNIGIFTYDDLFQIGCVGLCKAADSYQPEKASIQTYSYILIRNEIYDALKHATVIRANESADPAAQTSGSRAEGPPDAMFYDIETALDAAQAGASGVYKKGITAIRMLANGYTHREIGERYGATANNVSAWVARARKYLRARSDIAAIAESL